MSISAVMRSFRIKPEAQTRSAKFLKYNPTDFQTLRLLADEAHVTPSILADRLRIPRATATSLTDRLEKKGLLHRRHSADDRRSITLTLTPRGKKAAAAIAEEDMDNCRLMLDALDASQRQSFLKNLEKIAQRVSQED
ncbi:MAG: MarR family transcriptional regulator [Pseudomonadota bacterium]